MPACCHQCDPRVAKLLVDGRPEAPRRPGPGRNAPLHFALIRSAHPPSCSCVKRISRVRDARLSRRLPLSLALLYEAHPAAIKAARGRVPRPAPERGRSPTTEPRQARRLRAAAPSASRGRRRPQTSPPRRFCEIRPRGRVPRRPSRPAPKATNCLAVRKRMAMWRRPLNDGDGGRQARRDEAQDRAPAAARRPPVPQWPTPGIASTSPNTGIDRIALSAIGKKFRK